MSLADALRELAERLPERVRLMEDGAPGWSMVRLQAELFWHTVLEVYPTGHRPVVRCASAILEVALREECEARGWYWEVRPRAYDKYPYFAMVSDWDRLRFEGAGNTPAEAMTHAVLKALKSETP